MENSTYTAIDYNSYENRVIENRIKEYYPRVKALIESIKDDTLDVNGRIYFRVPMKRLKGYKYLFHTAFWFPVSKDYNAERIKILECALNDLERIKREGDNLLFEFDKPIIG